MDKEKKSDKPNKLLTKNEPLTKILGCPIASFEIIN